MLFFELGQLANFVHQHLARNKPVGEVPIHSITPDEFITGLKEVAPTIPQQNRSFRKDIDKYIKLWEKHLEAKKSTLQIDKEAILSDINSMLNKLQTVSGTASLQNSMVMFVGSLEGWDPQNTMTTQQDLMSQYHALQAEYKTMIALEKMKIPEDRESQAEVKDAVKDSGVVGQVGDLIEHMEGADKAGAQHLLEVQKRLEKPEFKEVRGGIQELVDFLANQYVEAAHTDSSVTTNPKVAQVQESVQGLVERIERISIMRGDKFTIKQLKEEYPTLPKTLSSKAMFAAKLRTLEEFPELCKEAKKATIIYDKSGMFSRGVIIENPEMKKQFLNKVLKGRFESQLEQFKSGRGLKSSDFPTTAASQDSKLAFLQSNGASETLVAFCLSILVFEKKGRVDNANARKSAYRHYLVPYINASFKVLYERFQVQATK